MDEAMTRHLVWVKTRNHRREMAALARAVAAARRLTKTLR